MIDRRTWLTVISALGLPLALGSTMNAEAGLLGQGVDSWTEEVQLHDGGKLIVQRSQSYGGRREIGQLPPIKEHTITFTLPNYAKTITWTSEYAEDLGRTNFNLLAVHVLRATPFIAASPNLSLSYNKWGRPNPPYVLFKYEGNVWQRIALEEFPVEFKAINVALNIRGRDVENLVSLGFISAAMVNQLNSSVTQEEYKSIVRTPLDHWKPRPVHLGPKAPNPINPPATIGGKN